MDELRAEAIAVSRAEEFVRVNGYVSSQDADATRTARESCCSGPDTAPNSVEWFQDHGRAVVMDQAGNNPRIVHQDFRLRAKGLKRLRGMALLEAILHKQAAQPRIAADQAVPGG